MGRTRQFLLAQRARRPSAQSKRRAGQNFGQKLVRKPYDENAQLAINIGYFCHFDNGGGESDQISIYRPQSHMFADIQETPRPKARAVRRTSRGVTPIRVQSSRMYGPEYGPEAIDGKAKSLIDPTAARLMSGSPGYQDPFLVRPPSRSAGPLGVPSLQRLILFSA